MIDWKCQAEDLCVTDRASYPRLYQLRDGTLLCGIDGLCFRSNDDGDTWSEGYDYRRNHDVQGANGKIYTLGCANTAFFELTDGTLLVGYRATGYLADDNSVFCTQCSDMVLQLRIGCHWRKNRSERR